MPDTKTYFAQMPEVILVHPALSSNAVRLYGIMLRRAGNRGHFYDSQTYLTELIGLKPASVKETRRAIKQLVDVKAIRVDKTTKINGQRGGDKYHVLDPSGITAVDAERAHSLLAVNQAGVPEASAAVPPVGHAADQGRFRPTTEGESTPSPGANTPLRPDTVPDTDEDTTTAAPRSAQRSTNAVAERQRHRHEAQWHAKVGENSKDRAIRLVARALTKHFNEDVLPLNVAAVTDCDPDELDGIDLDIHYAVDDIRTHNTNGTNSPIENMVPRLNDDQILAHLHRALEHGDLANLNDYLDEVDDATRTLREEAKKEKDPWK